MAPVPLVLLLVVVAPFQSVVVAGAQDGATWTWVRTERCAKKAACLSC
jgi:hypothetical protein